MNTMSIVVDINKDCRRFILVYIKRLLVTEVIYLNMTFWTLILRLALIEQQHIQQKKTHFKNKKLLRKWIWIMIEEFSTSTPHKLQKFFAWLHAQLPLTYKHQNHHQSNIHLNYNKLEKWKKNNKYFAKAHTITIKSFLFPDLLYTKTVTLAIDATLLDIRSSDTCCEWVNTDPQKRENRCEKDSPHNDDGRCAILTAHKTLEEWVEMDNHPERKEKLTKKRTPRLVTTVDRIRNTSHDTNLWSAKI